MRLSACILAFALPLPRAVTGDAASIAGPEPKMVAEEVTSTSKPNLFEPGKEMAGKTISSRNAVYIGDCSPSEPFAFPLGSRSGRGVVGSYCGSVADSIVVSDGEGRNVTMEGEPQQNFFALASPVSDEFCGVAFTFGDSGDPKGQGKAKVACTGGDTPVIVILREDDAGSDGAASIEATVSCRRGVGRRNGKGRGNVRGPRQRLRLSKEAASRSRAILSGQTRGRGRGGAKARPADFSGASKSEITIKRQEGAPGSDSGLSLVQVVLDDGSGGEVRRTFITESDGCGRTGKKRRLRSVGVRSSSVNDDGDIELDFDLDGLPELRPPGQDGEAPRFKVKARIGIVSSSAEQDGGLAPENSTASAEGVHRIVDVSAFLSRERSTMVVHGGWVRRARRALSSDSERSGAEWDVVVEEAVVLDPEEGYRTVARLAGVHTTGVGRGRARNRRLIADAPTEEELGVSEEMLQGRRPARSNRGQRGLQAGSQSKILVHGYCSDRNPFPTDHFTDAVEFEDPDGRRRKLGGDGGGNNWSNDEFAIKIDNFAKGNGIAGCGIVAHSQGGLAALHLYNNYWSCLDNANRRVDGRLIQTVGSPFRGTALAGNLAAIGGVFGAGCGTNDDLTESGAERWLAGTSSWWARGAINYQTTSFETKWWRYDYCSLATDLFLGDPEDGTVERGRGELPGGVNRGHKTGWCHTTGMRDPTQTSDRDRNKEMNDNAKY